MRLGYGAGLLLALSIAGCGDAQTPPPPPAQDQRPGPPPVAPPSPSGSTETNRWDWCGTQVPPRPRPVDAPTREECEARTARGLSDLRAKALADDPGVWIPAGGLPPLGQRSDPGRGTGSWLQRLTPSRPGNCSFTERPSTARPADLDLLAWSGNMDLYGQGNLLMHDHAIGFVEASWNARRPVIAVRLGMDDLWITPEEPWDRVVLIIGAGEFYCSRAGGQ